MYAATWITVESQEFGPDGCFGPRNELTAGAIHHSGETLQSLIEVLCDWQCIDVPKSIFFADGWIKLDRLEDIDRNPIDGGDTKTRAWLVDYSFLIEKRVVTEVTAEEFAAESIELH